MLLCMCLVSVMKRGQPDEAPCLSFDMQLFSDFPLNCPIKHFLVSPDAFLARGNVTLGVGPSLLGPLYKPQASQVWCPYMILHASCRIGTLLQQALMILAWLTSKACVLLSSVMFHICIASALEERANVCLSACLSLCLSVSTKITPVCFTSLHTFAAKAGTIWLQAVADAFALTGFQWLEKCPSTSCLVPWPKMCSQLTRLRLRGLLFHTCLSI